MSNAMAGSSGGGASYSYSSSSFMSNVNGVRYEESKTARMGPGGVGLKPRWLCLCPRNNIQSLYSQVKEMQKSIRDGRTGHESIAVSRSLGDKVRITNFLHVL